MKKKEFMSATDNLLTLLASTDCLPYLLLCLCDMQQRRFSFGVLKQWYFEHEQVSATMELLK